MSEAQGNADLRTRRMAEIFRQIAEFLEDGTLYCHEDDMRIQVFEVATELGETVMDDSGVSSPDSRYRMQVQMSGSMVLYGKEYAIGPDHERIYS